MAKAILISLNSKKAINTKIEMKTVELFRTDSGLPVPVKKDDFKNYVATYSIDLYAEKFMEENSDFLIESDENGKYSCFDIEFDNRTYLGYKFNTTNW